MKRNFVFNGDELSNNHLIASTPYIEKVIRSMRTGDQIMISGKLVNVEAKAIGKREKYESADISWQTSVVRGDSMGGACEIIYVTDAKIIKRGPRLSPMMTFSLSGLAVTFLVYFAGYLLRKRYGQNRF